MAEAVNLAWLVGLLSAPSTETRLGNSLDPPSYLFHLCPLLCVAEFRSRARAMGTLQEEGHPLPGGC